MRNDDAFLLGLAFVEQMKRLYVPPALLDNPDLPHMYSSKRFTPDLQPINFHDIDGKLIERPWSTKHNYVTTHPADPRQIRSASTSITSEHLWAKLLLGTFTLGVMSGAAEELSCLLLDIDFKQPTGATASSLLEMQVEERAMLMEELAQAVRRVEVRLQMKLHPHWMASGGMGCWLHLFFADPCSRSMLGALLEMIREELPHQVGRFLIKLCGSNLENAACRMPLSRHMKTKRQAVYLDAAGWTPCRDQLQYIFAIERVRNPILLGKRLGDVGGDRCEPLVLHTGAGRRGEGWAKVGEARSSSTPPPPPSQGVHAFGQLPRWTIPQFERRLAAGESLSLPGPWVDYLPASLPAGQTQALLIDTVAQARSLAAIIAAGILDPARPVATFPWAEFLAECRQRLEGDADMWQQRLQEIEGRVHQDLKQMAVGQPPHLPPVIMLEEWEEAAALAHQIIDAKPKTVKRRGSVADMTAVLRFVAIKAQGEVIKFTQERAVRHLGWADWDLEETAPTVQAARGRLERVLAWIMEGTDNQATLKLPPLLRRVQKRYRHSGHSAPSEYEVLWENWRGGFVGRTSGSSEASSDTPLGGAGTAANRGLDGAAPMGKGSISTTMRAAVEKLRFGVGDEDEPLRTSPTLAADRTLAQLDYLCSI